MQYYFQIIKVKERKEQVNNYNQEIHKLKLKMIHKNRYKISICITRNNKSSNSNNKINSKNNKNNKTKTRNNICNNSRYI